MKNMMEMKDRPNYILLKRQSPYIEPKVNNLTHCQCLLSNPEVELLLRASISQHPENHSPSLSKSFLCSFSDVGYQPDQESSVIPLLVVIIILLLLSVTGSVYIFKWYKVILKYRNYWPFCFSLRSHLPLFLA